MSVHGRKIPSAWHQHTAMTELGRLGFVDAARGLATQFTGDSEKAREI